MLAVWFVGLTAVLTFGRYHGDGRIVARDMKALESIMADLEYIEQQETIQRSGVGGNEDLDILSAREATCEAALNVDPKRATTGFSDLVTTNLNLWNECTAIWNWQAANAEWNFETNINDDTEAELNRVLVKVSGFYQTIARIAKLLMTADDFQGLNEDAKRQLRLYAMDDAPKSDDDKRKMSEVQTKLQNIYSNARVEGKSMEPELTKLMASSRNANELERLWLGWRDVTGKLMKEDYVTFVDYLNKGATDNGYHDYGQSWLERQFDDVQDIRAASEVLWKEIEPLYQQLHAYVRTVLRQHYPQYSKIYDKGGIPAHLTGNMWAQQWNNIYKLVKPFPEIEEPNYEEALRVKFPTANALFNLSENFYTSIGLFPMPEKFHELSMKVRPPGVDVVCHASASDFFLNDDVRIKMCTEINTEYLDIIHHEMGHVEYFIAYKDQPTIYRTGANSGFHEAIGDTISLSVMTPKHMRKILFDDEGDEAEVISESKSKDELTDEQKGSINFLMKVALSKIAFLPFGYMIDKWRWDVFDGTITKDNYNRHWWELRLRYQGIVSPVKRSEEDFDPGAKFHIASNSPYICYFVSHLLQFQFYEAMCEASGQLDNNAPLHNCDFYQSKEAGTLLRDMLSLGESRPWDETLQSMTGSPHISTSSILRYFAPLRAWLEKVNSKKRHSDWLGGGGHQFFRQEREGKSRRTVYQCFNYALEENE